MNQSEIFEQLARQLNQEGKQCDVRVHTVPDEYFTKAYGKARAKVTILIPENVAQELEKYN